MKQVTLTAREYKHWIFPGIGFSNCDAAHEWATQLRLLQKLKDPKLVEPVPVTKEDLAEADKSARPSFTVYTLRGDSADFEFEEDELALLYKRIDAGKMGIPAIGADEYEALLQKLKVAREAT